MTRPGPFSLHLLLVDADVRHRALVRQALGRAEPSARLTVVGRLRTAVDVLRRERASCIVTEIELPDARGSRILRELRAVGDGAPIVVATARGSEAHAVAAMKQGAADYVRTDGGPAGALEASIRGALGSSMLRCLEDASAAPASAEAQHVADGTSLVATAAAMRAVLCLADRASRSTVPVLIEGETGTGKELLARTIHQRGPRPDAPFLAQNCAAIPESLLESELFGHVRGAFTGADRERRGLFADAEDGTVFLDEIGEAPPAVQAKLLRVIQNGEVKAVGADRVRRVHARIIAATNRQLDGEIGAGRFRSDLYYRLAVFPIRIPALRHRRADIVPLLVTFLRRFEAEEGRATQGFSPEALRLLQSYPWPGNARELEHEVHRLVLTVPAGARVRPEHLAGRIRNGGGPERPEPLAHILARVELAVIRQRLEAEPTKAAAARSLGITREALYAKLRRLAPPAG